MYSSYANHTPLSSLAPLPFAGDQLHLLLNRQAVGQATFSDIRVLSLCATTGDVMNRNSVGTLTTTDTEQATNMALSRWNVDGTPCDGRDCTMLVCANIYDTATAISPLEKVSRPQPWMTQARI
jgi:hypothetical protein